MAQHQDFDTRTGRLRSLPMTRDPELLIDPLLPVVGPTMALILQPLAEWARRDESILLRGPTGVGKTRLARWCCARSGRAGRAWVVVNLHAVPETLHESHLFGSRRGAYTSSVENVPGVLREAEGGTLFLDEIDKLSLAAQAKLLQVIEERRYREVGGIAERSADVRFIVGTNADLEARVRQGLFLQDLLYRINLFSVSLPPLRRRTDEIALWADYMLKGIQVEQEGHSRAFLTEAANDLLRSQRWAGNLRELRNVVVRAHFYARRELDGDTLVVEHRHVAQAIAQGQPAGGEGIVDELRSAAELFVEEAIRRTRTGEEGLPLELGDGLVGFILSVATERLRSVRGAFELFGKEAQFRGGNHLKTYRRECGRARELCLALGGDVPGWLGVEL